jgi:hypothetical protein
MNEEVVLIMGCKIIPICSLHKPFTVIGEMGFNLAGTERLPGLRMDPQMLEQR